MVSVALLLVSTFLFSFAAAAPASAGLNGDPCTTALQCRGTRTCYYLPLDDPSSFGPCDGREECFCGQLELTDMICESDDDCDEAGEVCASVLDIGVSGCISVVAVDRNPQITRTDAGEDDETTDDILQVGSVDSEPSPPPMQLFPDDVESETSSVPLQVQPDDPDSEISPLPTDELLDDIDVQISPEPTDELLDGIDAEISPEPTDELLDDIDAEISPESTSEALDDFDPELSPQPEKQPLAVDATLLPNDQGQEGVTETEEPQPSPESESSCIAVHHLQHLSSEQLLFDNHVRATVLCDEHGSCATPGHIVRFDGRAMMMKSYCKVVGCESGVQLVNSPKYVRKLSVASKSPRLAFTAFAARYGSRVEEKVLNAAVRFGL